MSGIQTNEIKYFGSAVPLSQDRCGVALMETGNDFIIGLCKKEMMMNDMIVFF